MIALVERGHETWQDTQLTWPSLGDTKGLLSGLASALKDGDVLANYQNACDKISSEVRGVYVTQSLVVRADFGDLGTLFKLQKVNEVYFLESRFAKVGENIRQILTGSSKPLLKHVYGWITSSLVCSE